MPFPFAQVAEELAETAGPNGFPNYMKQPLFWGRFCHSGRDCAVVYHRLFRSRLSRDYRGGFRITTFRWDAYVPSLHGRLNFLIIGFAYFTDLQVLFSIWVFWVLTWLQIGMTNRMGLADGPGGVRRDAATGIGAVFIVFCLWGLWIARFHLKAVFQHAFRKPKNMDDQKRVDVLPRGGVCVFGLCVVRDVLVVQGRHDADLGRGGHGVLVRVLHGICQNCRHDRAGLPRIPEQVWARA